jgi:predicted nucleic acid-binding protein
MRKVIFDAFALIAYLDGEPGTDFVHGLLQDARRGSLWAGVCSVNLGEVYYRTYRQQGAGQAEEVLRYLRALELRVLSATDDLVWAAARLKARYPISYADAFALACAIEHEADLVTDDPELRAADHGVPIVWGAD